MTPTLDNPEDKNTWSIHDVVTGEKVFESDNPQAVVDEAARLEEAAKDRDTGVGNAGIAAACYSIQGDPFELGVMQEHHINPRTGERKLVRGPKEMRKPKKPR